MKKLSFTLAAAVSVGALYATTSHADDPATSPSPSTDEEAAPPTIVQPSPQQPPAPVQSVTVHTSPASEPAATTRTTSAPMIAQPRDAYAESSTAHRPHRALMSTGIGMFVLSYGASVVAGAVSSADADKNLFVPVAGPWMDLSERSGGGSNEDLNKALIITSGVAQGAGVLLALSSLVIPETTTTKSRSGSAKAVDPDVRVAPLSFRAGAGLGAIGRF